MKPLYEQDWFDRFITWCRKWDWFDTYIYGKSVNLEDFVRNPAEVLRDTYFPFIVKDIKPYSIFNLRIGYIQFDENLVDQYIEEISKYITPSIYEKYTYWSIPLGDHHLIIKNKKFVLFDFRYFNKYWTKYVNSFLSFQLAFSMKKFIPIPFFSLVFRFCKTRYFQLGIGWGPQPRGYLSGEMSGIYDTTLTFKCRIGEYVKEVQWNPGSEVFGYYEGTC